MKFWQSIVTAQLAAGSVYADRIDAFVPHLLAETLSVMFGAAMWMWAEKLWPTEKGR